MPAPPFILLDDARPGGAVARLYREPVDVIVARDIAAVRPALAAVRAGVAAGLHAAGYLAYEAAAAFEPSIATPSDVVGPLLWFGLFDRFAEIADVAGWLPDPAGAWNGPAEPLIDRASYDARLADALALIDAGDLYQANLTFPAHVRVAGDPLALFARLRAASAAGYGAVIATGDETLLSLSPELFFALHHGQVTVRPMKGTARREADPAVDRAAAQWLAEDPKQRAENLMIVDLMRNDLSRIARAGSVEVPQLFAVESYPTVHQLVSTVTAALVPGKDTIDVLSALFPCGSITGAPKIRAIEALAAIEGHPRGIYTGTIGRIDPGGDAMFNVAIRTLRLPQGDAPAVIGLGGGIVADSTSAGEWAEAQTKAAFLTAGQRGFDLIETMAFDPVAGMPLLERHLARMKASALVFGFAFDRHAARNELQAATFRLAAPSRVRLLLSASGAFAIETAPAPPPPQSPVSIAVRPLPVPARDFRLRHKTSDRGFYDTARAASGQFEVVFTDAEGFVTEGSFTSVFVARGGVLLTPPLARGLLPGVLRASLIDSGRAVEADLTLADFDQGLFIGNALRGLIPAVVAPSQQARL